MLTVSNGNSKEDFDRAKALANDAVKSGSYLYPIKVCSHTFDVKPSRPEYHVDDAFFSLTLGNLLLHEPPQPLEAPP